MVWASSQIIHLLTTYYWISITINITFRRIVALLIFCDRIITTIIHLLHEEVYRAIIRLIGVRDLIHLEIVLHTQFLSIRQRIGCLETFMGPHVTISICTYMICKLATSTCASECHESIIAPKGTSTSESHIATQVDNIYNRQLICIRLTLTEAPVLIRVDIITIYFFEDILKCLHLLLSYGDVVSLFLCATE